MNEEENKFVPPKQKISSRCQTTCQSNLPEFITTTKVPFGNLFRDVTTVKKLGTFDLTATNYMVDHYILINCNQPSQHQEKIMFNKSRKLRR